MLPLPLSKTLVPGKPQATSSVIFLSKFHFVLSLLTFFFLSTTNVKILKLFWDNDQVFTIFSIFHEHEITQVFGRIIPKSEDFF